ncbi:methyltransferase FkbM family [Rhodomicrobium vannielii ATCC 17100]|uniref:Methyltransferase FkbM family n=1 Tax=Rhodomicrobium vannielii (strain ATCC 17100 / DSM 162 / LMG 4299 / NCIMB 10020 / ATH 3.1.1) TaxID=648757 RepID=E3I0Z0_RHOVT|nr:FkbM family methyltransferase [Rhodomicrobium vannielii]ADP72313.1 methyltransferase FkbM family [Rhodomicrobium vannielii ATCC 17100]
MQNYLKRAVRKAGRLAVVDTAYLYSRHEQVHLKRIFREFDVDLVIDVGANRGQYATMLRQRVGYKGAIVSVEPIPDLVEHLRHISRDDPLWYVEPVVLGDRHGPHRFHIMADSQCSSLNEPSFAETDAFREQLAVSDSITVQGETLDSLFDRWSQKIGARNPFLKLDTQGSDLAILSAAPDTLPKLIGFQSELSIKRLYENTLPMEEALLKYKALGFDISALVPNNAGHFPYLVEIDCIMLRRGLRDITHG